MTNIYNEFIEKLNLKELYFSKLEYKRLSNPNSKLYPTINILMSVQKLKYNKTKKNNYRVSFPVELELNQENSEKKQKKLFNLKIIGELLVESEIELTEEIFLLFVKKNIPLIIHPYIREAVQNCLLRANLPAIPLPLIVI